MLFKQSVYRDYDMHLHFAFMNYIIHCLLSNDRPLKHFAKNMVNMEDTITSSILILRDAL